MEGLRTAEDSRFEKFWEAIVQPGAKKQGGVFFCDFGDMKDIEHDGMLLDRVVGWLIPQALAKEFESQFLSNNVDEDRWADFIVTEDFEIMPDGSVEVTFNN